MSRTLDGVKLEGTITPDHKLVAEVPEDMLPGKVDIWVEQPAAPSLDRFKRTLIRIAGNGRKGRTSEEIDAQIQELRDSWER